MKLSEGTEDPGSFLKRYVRPLYRSETTLETMLVP